MQPPSGGSHLRWTSREGGIVEKWGHLPSTTETLDQIFPDVRFIPRLCNNVSFFPLDSFLSNKHPHTPIFFFCKLGPPSIRKCFVTLLTISQRLSEKCYSQKLLLQLSCLYRDLDSIPGSRKSWRSISLENSRFPIFKEQSNTLLESNVPMVLRRSTSSLQVGWVSLLINSMTFNEHKAHTPQTSIPHYFT